MPSAYMKIYLLRDFSILWLVFLIIWWKNELLTFFFHLPGSQIYRIDWEEWTKELCFIYSFTYLSRLDSIWISAIKFLSVFVTAQFQAKSQEIWICDLIKIININLRVGQIIANRKFGLNNQLHIVFFFLSVTHFCFYFQMAKAFKEKRKKWLHIFFFHFFFKG